jgi:hypothetical protein
MAEASIGERPTEIPMAFDLETWVQFTWGPVEIALDRRVVGATVIAPTAPTAENRYG